MLLTEMTIVYAMCTFCSLPPAQAGPGTTVRLTRIHQQFSAYPFTADGQYLPAPQAFYAVAPNGTGSLLPTPLFLSLLPTSYSNLAGVRPHVDAVAGRTDSYMEILLLGSLSVCWYLNSSA